MYSRYIPPKKRPEKSANLSMQSQIERIDLPNSTPSSIRSDASSSYARYIPPSKTSRPLIPSLRQDASPEKAFEKAQKNGETVQQNLSQFQPTDGRHKKSRLATDAHGSKTSAIVEDVKAESQPTKKRKKRPEGTEGEFQLQDDELVAQELGDDSRHQKLMLKREKSIRKAEKLARKEARRAAKEIESTSEAEVVEEDPVELHNLIPLPQPAPILQQPSASLASVLPEWLASPIRVSPTTRSPFLELGLDQGVVRALQSRGFTEAFAIQTVVLKLLLPGPSQHPGDILVSAATGSGKTLAYVLPMVRDLSKTTTTKLRGLIVVPTRDLVTQARDVCEACAGAFAADGGRRVKIGTAIGNEALKIEQAALVSSEDKYDPKARKEQQTRLDAKWNSAKDESASDVDTFCGDEKMSDLFDHVLDYSSKIDILICTPGRLVEHLNGTTGFTLEDVVWLVVDEADKLLGQMFQQWLRLVVTNITQTISRECQLLYRVRKIVLSATMTCDVGQLNDLALYRPKLVTLEAGEREHGDEQVVAHALPALLRESGVKVSEEDLKPLYLMEVLSRASSSLAPKRVYPSPDISDSYGALIFTKSNEAALRLTRLMIILRPEYADVVGTLSSSTPSSTRKLTLKNFHAKKLSILVASDLVSRGLDIPNLAHVINYDMPNSVESYMHRVGRTARAGKTGQAWTLFSASEGRWFWNEIARSDRLQRDSDSKVERVTIPSDIFTPSAHKDYASALDILGKETASLRTERDRAT